MTIRTVSLWALPDGRAEAVGTNTSNILTATAPSRLRGAVRLCNG